MQQHVFAIARTCASFGVKHVVICPGSRSAPLVYAFTSDPTFSCYSVIDERSAGYMALGMAQQSNIPVVVICTSGTAALNLYPAIAEAYFQKIPLLILTADRPAELLYQQDGQMINQHNVFGANILSSFNLPSYAHGKESPSETAKTTLDALKTASGKPNGPVHLNIPLHEPLYPNKVNIKAPISSLSQNNSVPSSTAFENKDLQIFQKTWVNSTKKLILIGQMPVSYDLFSALYRLNRREDVVILCDTLSNQHGFCTSPHFDFILSHADEKTIQRLSPDCVVSFGGPVLSKALKIWLKGQKPEVHYRIQEEKQLVDTYNNVTRFVSSSPHDFLNLFVPDPIREPGKSYKKLWHSLGSQAKHKVEEFLKSTPFNELQAVSFILNKIPDAVNLQLANSSVVRYVGWSGSLNPSWTINGNRGTSGIDGCSSTAIGAAILNNKLTVLLTGDLAFLYDKNAFWNHHVPDNLRIIVINNNGGGIFTLIDGPSDSPVEQNWFTTPHQQSVKSTALDNGLEYYFCDSLVSLDASLRSFFNPKQKATVLEVKLDMKKNAALFKAFKRIKL